MVAAWPLVGRADELEYLGEALGRRPGGVLVAGAAGVGKSRLVAEALATYRGRGGRAAVCLASRSGASVPLGALTPVLDGVIAQGDLSRVFSAAPRAIAARLDGGVLAIDDVHLLDEPSAALVLQLARTADVALLVTLRTGEPAPDAVQALWKDELLERLELQPLARCHETRALLEEVLGGPVSDVALARLFEASMGNVLFLRELVLDARQRDQLRERDGVWSWSGQVRAGPRLATLVARNMDRLTDDERRLVELVALVEPLPVAVAERLVAVDTVDRVERGGMVTVDAALQMRLGHPLYGEVVRAQLPVSRLRAHVRELVSAFAGAASEHSAGLDLRLAMLHLDAGEPAAGGLLEAGSRRASSSGDPKLGERLARQALENDPDSYGAGHALGMALVEQGRYVEGDEVMASLVGREPDERSVAQLARARMTALYFAGGDRRARAADVVAEAAARVTSPAQRAALLTARSEVHLNEAEFDAALALVEPVLADSALEDSMRFRAGIVVSMATTLSGRPVSGATVAHQLEPIARRAAERTPGALGWFVFDRWLGLMFAGQLDDAQALCRGLLDTEHRSSHAVYLAGTLHLFDGRVELLRGHLSRAAVSLRQAVVALRTEDPRGYLEWALGLLAAAVAATGDQVEAGRLLEESKRSPSHARRGLFDADRRLAGAWVHAAAGDLTAARAEATHIATRAADDGMHAFAVVALYEAARLGERSVWERLVDLTGRCEGVLASAIATHIAALQCGGGDHLMAAAEQLAVIGLTLSAAEASAQAAMAYRTAGHRDPALRSAARSSALAAECDGVRTPILAGADVTRPRLTRREIEVAELAARGSTNQDIAERLFTSVRTVEGHLLRAYGKLGIRSRQELADALGLTAAPRDDAILGPSVPGVR